MKTEYRAAAQIGVAIGIGMALGHIARGALTASTGEWPAILVASLVSAAAAMLAFVLAGKILRTT